VEKYGRAGKATDDNTVHAHCMLDTYTKKTHTHIHTGCVILIAFPQNNSCKNVPQCYVIHTLPVFFYTNILLVLYRLSGLFSGFKTMVVFP
jgi:hypothetical protein